VLRRFSACRRAIRTVIRCGDRDLTNNNGHLNNQKWWYDWDIYIHTYIIYIYIHTMGYNGDIYLDE